MSKIQRRSPLSDGSEGPLLSEDVIVSEILARLAVKPLFRFKCISKRYNSIISDPTFRRNYVQRALSSWKLRCSLGLRPSLLYPFTNQKALKDTSIYSVHITSITLPSSRNGDETHKILGSSNGLILSLFHPHPHEPENRRFILCVSNPLTKRSVELPELSLYPQTNYSVDWLFGFAARRAQQAITYKVVLIRKFGWRDGVINEGGTYNVKTSICIFSSDTGSWATKDRVTCPKSIFYTGQALFSCKATLHWILDRCNAIGTYDPFNSPGTFGRIALPSNKRTLYITDLADGSQYISGAQCMVYSGEQQGLRFVQLTRRNQETPCSHTWKMWRLVDRNKRASSWRTVRHAIKSTKCEQTTKCVIPSMPYLCHKLLIAPTSDVLCHPFVLENKLTVFHTDTNRDPPVTRKVLEGMVLETPEGFEDGDFRNPLVPIDLCPWASPSFCNMPLCLSSE